MAKKSISFNGLKGLGERLKEARNNSGKTQTEIAKFFNIAQSMLTRWENGETEPPIGYLEYAVMVLGASSIDWLINGEESGGRGPGGSSTTGEKVPFKVIPVFDLDSDDPLNLIYGGNQVGSSRISVPENEVDGRSFGLLVGHDPAMEPVLSEGDVAVVVPSAPLISGKLCYAILPDGKKVIRRYQQTSPELIILESIGISNCEPIVLTGNELKKTRIFKVKKIVKSDV